MRHGKKGSRDENGLVNNVAAECYRFTYPVIRKTLNRNGWQAKDFDRVFCYKCVLNNDKFCERFNRQIQTIGQI